MITLNGTAVPLDTDPDLHQGPLLWWLREQRGLVGTRFGCGQGVCGACTVHVDGEPVRSCLMPLASVAGRRVTTVEGLGRPGAWHVVQQAWLDAHVPQCGYCQSGQMMAAAALLARHPDPTTDQVDAAMAGVLCRCGTQARIRAAITLAAQRLRDGVRAQHTEAAR